MSHIHIEKQKIELVLDTLHSSASHGQLQDYLNCFAEKAVFIGTDASECWEIEAFSMLCRDNFEDGKGWTYVPIERLVSINKDLNCAWFYERLKHEDYVEARGSGTLIKTDDIWHIVQYVLSFPVPNELVKTLVREVRQLNSHKVNK